MSKMHNRFRRQIIHIAQTLKRDRLAYMDVKDLTQHVHPDFERGNSVFAQFILIPYSRLFLDEMARFINYRAEEEGLLMELATDYDEKSNRYHVTIAPVSRSVRREFWEEHTEKLLGELPKMIQDYYNHKRKYIK